MLHSSTKFNIEKSLIEKTGAPSCSKVAKRQDKEEEKIIFKKKTKRQKRPNEWCPATAEKMKAKIIKAK